jgi:DNA polymerase-4
MWPLPVDELFMVGRQTKRQLHQLGIHTIGDLAQANTDMLYTYMKSHGLLIQSFARGLDHSPVRKSNFEVVKGIGNSTTIRFDANTYDIAYKVLLSLCETICMRLRSSELVCQLISVSIVTADFKHASHQRKLYSTTDSTSHIFYIAKELFDELWAGSPIRKLGIRISELSDNDFTQLCVLDTDDYIKEQRKDHAVDQIRRKHGTTAIYRACFLHSGIKPMSGGVGEEHYPVMTSLL